MQLTNMPSTNSSAANAESGSGIVKGLVSVVIPNWNGKKFLKGCLDSLLECSYGQIEIVMVDNGSKDGSVEFLEENYPEVKLIKFEQNTGFSVAVNAGINHSTGEFVALLNNDTTVDPLWITNMVGAMREHPEIGSTGCKMLAYDDHKPVRTESTSGSFVCCL